VLTFRLLEPRFYKGIGIESLPFLLHVVGLAVARPKDSSELKRTATTSWATDPLPTAIKMSPRYLRASSLAYLSSTLLLILRRELLPSSWKTMLLSTL
jgi:hypothetical protein